MIPDSSTFLDMGVDGFRADANYKAIFRYID